MKRIYTLTISIEGEFRAKIKSSSWKRRLRAKIENVLSDPWEIVDAKIRSIAIPERTEKERVLSKTEILKEETLIRATRIMKEIRSESPTLPRVTIRWVDKGCRDRGGGYTAHVHRGQWYRREKIANPNPPWERYRRIRLPRNLICLLNVKRVSAMDDERLASLLCHEIVHFSMKKGHGTKPFVARKAAILQRWKAKILKEESAASA